MRLSELIAGWRDVEVRGPGGIEIAAIGHDSRAVTPGTLFVCIQGFRHDGHRFIPDALARGASAVLVQAGAAPSVPPGVPLVAVPDTRVALARVAARFHGEPSRALQLVGITGTNGKTTSAYLVEAILNAAGRPTGLLGTIEYRLGSRTFPGERTTPESADLQRLLAEMRDQGARAAAMEVSSHSLVLHRVEGCEFDVGVFTNLTQDHLDFHGTMQAYADAKAMLFRMLGRDRSKPAQAGAVLNADDPWAGQMAQAAAGARVLRFSLERPADLRPRELHLDLAGIRAIADSPWGPFEVRSPLVGRHNVQNLLGAAGACLHLGVAPDVVAEGIRRLRAVPGRFEKVEAGQPFGVVVDYAHTPDALERVLQVAREYAPARVIALFGCGGDRDRTKRPIMGEIAARLADLVIVTSDNPRSEEPGAIIREIEAGAKKVGRPAEARVTIPDRREAIGAALARARTGDLVVIAGKGHETYQVLRDRTIPFDDRVVAREALAALGHAASPHGSVPRAG
jgi:UDP-N-acetylmuramoyl-L-alanyl-D-glutamate--2,6-diaminopimelate ligase